LFIFKCAKIQKIDNEEVTDLDREISRRFVMENNSLSGVVRPNTSKIMTSLKTINPPIYNISTEEILNNSNNINSNKSVIQKIDYKPPIENLPSKEMKNHPLKMIRNSIKNNSITSIEFSKKDTSIDHNKNNNEEIIKLTQIDQLKRELELLRNENKKLHDTNKAYEMDFVSLKLELENSLNMNGEYEKIIEDYKKGNKSNAGSNIFKADEENIKLRREVDMWRREYFDLLGKNMDTGTTNQLLTEFEFNKVRPQTAYIKPSTGILKSNTFEEKSYSGIDNSEYNEYKPTSATTIKRKNSLDDSLNDSNDNIEDNSSEDHEIDDLLRKSVTNLNSIKTEIKYI
jgi:hypothetical protein